MLVIRREGAKRYHYGTQLQNMRKAATDLQKLILFPQLQINYLIVKVSVASPAAGVYFWSYKRQKPAAGVSLQGGDFRLAIRND